MQTAQGQELSIEERTTVAREHSALFPTRLALARWTSGDVPQLHNADAHYHPHQRAAWLAKAQADFQAWLDRGGFVQHDPDVNASGLGDGHQPVFWAI
jgi:hypothetical protein